MNAQTVLQFLRSEFVLVSGALLSAVETPMASGSPSKIAVQGSLPLIVSAVVRALQSKTTTKEDPMADLTALHQAVADLSTAVTNAQSYVSQLKSEATPQTDVDAVTSQVQQLTSQVTAVTQPTA